MEALPRPDELRRRALKATFLVPAHRLLEYLDQPGTVTTPHEHPDSVMYTLSSFRRRLVQGDEQREVEIEAGTVGWLPAQQHHGENIGDTPTHAIFVELKASTARPGK